MQIFTSTCPLLFQPCYMLVSINPPPVPITNSHHNSHNRSYWITTQRQLHLYIRLSRSTPVLIFLMLTDILLTDCGYVKARRHLGKVRIVTSCHERRCSTWPVEIYWAKSAASFFSNRSRASCRPSTLHLACALWIYWRGGVIKLAAAS